MSPTRDSGVQQDRDERGGHISGAEENQDYLLVLQRGGGDVLSPSPHGYNTRNSPDTYQGGRCRPRCNGDIRGVFSKVTEFGGMPGRHITNKGGKPGRLGEHFMYRSCKAEVKIILERPELLPRCDHCWMHMPEAWIIKHIWTLMFNKSMDMRIIWRYV